MDKVPLAHEHPTHNLLVPKSFTTGILFTESSSSTTTRLSRIRYIPITRYDELIHSFNKRSNPFLMVPALTSSCMGILARTLCMTSLLQRSKRDFRNCRHLVRYAVASFFYKDAEAMAGLIILKMREVNLSLRNVAERAVTEWKKPKQTESIPSIDHPQV